MLSSQCQQHVQLRNVACRLSLFLSISLISCGEAQDQEGSERCSRADIGCFSPEWAVTGERYILSLLEAVPARPERGVNQWRVSLSKTVSNELIDQCQIMLTPYMPDHGHGSPLTPLVTPLSDGIYLIEEIAFTMPGLWEMRFDVSCDQEGQEPLIYPFWLEA